MAPSAKLVVKTYRPSRVDTAQQISLRPLPIDRDTGSRPAPQRYDEAAAAPTLAPKASVTTSVRSPAKAKPYGVGPDDGISWAAPGWPESSTRNETIEFVPRWVT